MMNILLQGTGTLNQIFNNAGSGITSAFSIGIYIIPIVIILFMVWLWRQRSKTGGKGVGQNQAIIFSVKQNFISEIKPFKVVRVMDKTKNVEETKAIFPDQQKKSGGIIAFFKYLLGQAGNQDDPVEEEGAVFSESLATYNKFTNGWLTIYSLETNTQLPMAMDRKANIQKNSRVFLQTSLVTENTEVKKVIDEMERNVERRVSRLKAAQLAITNYVQQSTPVQQLGTIQLVGFILIFIGIIALAIALNSVSSSISALSPILGTTSKVLQSYNAIINHP